MSIAKMPTLFGGANSAFIACLLVFHAPSGSDLTIESTSINAVRPAGEFSHLAHGTNAVLYVAGEKFGVRETITEVEVLIGKCKERLPEEQMGVDGENQGQM